MEWGVSIRYGMLVYGMGVLVYGMGVSIRDGVLVYRMEC